MSAGTRNTPPDQPTPAAVQDQNLLVVYRRLLTSLGIFASVTVVFYLIVFFASGANIWQAWVAVGLLSAALFFVPLVYWLIRTGHTDLAGALVLLGVSLGYGGNEIAWSGLTIYHLVGGLLLILLAGSLVLPRKRWIWLLMAGLYLGYLLLVNEFQPLQRYDATNLSVLFPYAIAANLLMALALTLQILIGLQQRTIRARFLVSAILLVLMPVVVVGGASWYLNDRIVQQRLQDQLTSVTVLKEAEINTWLDSLQVSLLLAAPSSAEFNVLETVIKGPTPGTEEFYQVNYRRVENNLRKVLTQTGAFEELYVMDPAQGVVVVSTDPTRVGAIRQEQDDFRLGKLNFTVLPPTRDPVLNRIFIIVAAPIQNEAGLLMGVLAGRANMSRLDAIMQERAGLGQSGETYLVSKNHVLLSAVRNPGFTVGETYIFSAGGINPAVDFERTGTGIYRNYADVAVIGAYRWLPALQVALVAEQEQAEARRGSLQALAVTVVVSVGAVLLAVLVSLYATNQITKPLAHLVAVAGRIASGDLQLTIGYKQEDEIGALAKAFESMTAQVRELVGGLEQRVAERTAELERRSLQLQVAAEIARDASSIRDLDELLNRAVNLIVERFDFYHAAIYLVDEQGKYAVLKAGTGEAGRQLLAQNFKMLVGEQGIIGSVAQNGLARIALDVNADSDYMKLSLLPDTRSEVALPLKVGPRIIGVLDVESSQEAAFDQDSVRILQIMADQLAVAIESARLFKETEDTLRELETAYGRFTQESWRKMLEQAGQLYGYRYQGLDVEPLRGQRHLGPEQIRALETGEPVVTALEAAEGERETAIAVPMKLRGQTVGVVNLRLRGLASPDVVQTYAEIANRLSIAIENARLLQETQIRTEQIRLLQEVTAEAASHIKLIDLLAAVTRKLQNGFGLSRCCAVLFDPARKIARLAADAAAPEMNAPLHFPLGSKLPLAYNDVFQQVIGSRTAFATYDACHDSHTAQLHDFFAERGTAVVAYLRLISRGEVIGVILLESADPQRQWSEDSLRLIEQISLQIAAAIDVARLFEQTESRAERERLIGYITSRIRETLDIETMIRTAAQELRQATGAPEIVLRLGYPRSLTEMAEPPGGERPADGNGRHASESK